MRLSNRDIEMVARRHWHTGPYFRGVFASDTLPPARLIRCNFLIVNTDVSSGSGKHWVLIVINKPGTAYEWFDSLGKSPMDYSATLHDYMTQQGSQPFIMNSKRIQSASSEHCGYFCLYVADKRCSGELLDTVMNDFSSDAGQLDNNDALVENYVQYHML